MSDFEVEFLGRDGLLHTIPLPTTKAHNLILDTTLSVGLLGLLSYLALFGFYLIQGKQSPYRGIEAVGIAYLAFTCTWFECAQFTHLAWWALSLGGTIPAGLNQSDSLSSTSINERPTEPTGSAGSRRLSQKTLKLLAIASCGFAAISATGYLANSPKINWHLQPALSVLVGKDPSSCGSLSGGPTDNPTLTKSGNADSWTNNIKWVWCKMCLSLSISTMN